MQTMIPVILALISAVTSVSLFFLNRAENARRDVEQRDAECIAAEFRDKQLRDQEEFRAGLTKEIEEHRALLDKRAKAERKAEDAEELFAKYRDPLLQAAYDLQSRLYNALGDIGLGGVDDEYVRTSTPFLLADFLGWVEITRRDMQFLDLGAERPTRELNKKLAAIKGTLATTTRLAGDPYFIYRADQRGIGELMMVPVAGAGTRPGPRYETIGYAEFCIRMKDPEFAGWFRSFGAEFPPQSRDRAPRLVELQWALIDLIDLLDPEFLRYSEFRSKIG